MIAKTPVTKPPFCLNSRQKAARRKGGERLVTEIVEQTSFGPNVDASEVTMAIRYEGTIVVLISLSLSLYIYIYIMIYISLSLYIYIYICIHTHVCVYIYIYIHIRRGFSGSPGGWQRPASAGVGAII